MTLKFSTVSLIGNLASDPTYKEYDDNKKMLAFTVAENRKSSKDGESTTYTNYHEFVIWDKVAEFHSTRLKKGSRVTVIGAEIRQKQITDEKGYKRNITFFTNGTICAHAKEEPRYVADKDSDIPNFAPTEPKNQQRQPRA